MGETLVVGARGESGSERRQRVWEGKKFQEDFWRWVALVVVLIGAAFVLIPFLWMVTTSLKTEMETYAVPPQWIPKQWMWRNYPDAMRLLPFGQFYRNTAFITFGSMIGAVMSSAIVAYAFGRLRAPGREAMFVVVLATMMLPGQVTLIPLYLLFNQIGWVNTYYPLIIPSFFGGGAFNIFLLRQFFMTIPSEMDDAAKMDGCGFFTIFWRLILPMSKPAMATVAIFHFMWQWNDFFTPLIYLNDISKYTVSLGLAFFRGSGMGSGRLDWMMAASVVALLPCLALFFVAQRLFIQGIVITGVKG